MDLTPCPECGHAAEIVRRDVFESTDGPVEHAQVVCVQRHRFLMPSERLGAPAMPSRALRHAEGRA